MPLLTGKRRHTKGGTSSHAHDPDFAEKTAERDLGWNPLWKVARSRRRATSCLDAYRALKKKKAWPSS
jgi:hypothetical protein